MEEIDFMQDHERLLLRQLHRQFMDETDSARLQFPVDKAVESLPVVDGQNALVEEIGKMSRCLNKLVIATDVQVVAQWRSEFNRRIVTSGSLIDRLYLKHRRDGETR